MLEIEMPKRIRTSPTRIKIWEFLWKESLKFYRNKLLKYNNEAIIKNIKETNDHELPFYTEHEISRKLNLDNSKVSRFLKNMVLTNNIKVVESDEYRGKHYYLLINESNIDFVNECTLQILGEERYRKCLQEIEEFTKHRELD